MQVPNTLSQGEGCTLRQRARPYVIAATSFFLLFVFNFSCAQLMETLDAPLANAAFAGVGIAQVLLFTLVAGCCGVHWLHGVLLGALLAMIATSSFLFGAVLSNRHVAEFFWFIACVPLLILCASLPLLALRYVTGYYLTWDRTGAATEKPIGMEDLLSATAVAAAFLSFTSLPLTFFSHPLTNLAVPFCICALIVATANLLTLTPVTWLTFRFTSWTSRLVTWLCTTLVCMAIALLVILIPPYQPLANVPFIIVPILTCAVTVVAGYGCMFACGVKLQRRSSFCTAKLKLATTDEVRVAVPATTTQRRALTSVGSPRSLTLTIVSLAAILQVWLTVKHVQQLSWDERQQALALQLQPQGGWLRTQDRRISELHLGKDADDQLLQRFTALSDLSSLSLADSQITDAGLVTLKSLKELQALDLSGTQITDAALPIISPLRLNSVSLARTHLSKPALFDFIRRNSLQAIDLSDTGFTDKDLPKLKGIPEINLSRNPITDAGVNWLLDQRNCRSLDLSYTDLDGSGWTNNRHSAWLNLDGTRIGDANLRAMLNHSPYTFFSVRHTGISPALFQGKLPATMGLGLGACGITEDDLAKCGTQHFHRLALNGSEFKGTCFSQGKISANHLDMSYSGISDDSVQYLTNVKHLRSLNLSHTQITDRALMRLAYLWLYEIDLRNTRVSADALTKLKYQRVLISHSQFTAKQLQQLRRQMRGSLVIDGDLELR